MREDEVRALEALERAWGLNEAAKLPSIVCPACGGRSFNIKDIAHQYCARCHKFHDDMTWNPKTGTSPDDGATPPNFLLVEQTEREAFSMPDRVPTWTEWAREVRDLMPPLFTVDSPWLTALVCVATAMATAAVVMSVVGR